RSRTSELEGMVYILSFHPRVIACLAATVSSRPPSPHSRHLLATISSPAPTFLYLVELQFLLLQVAGASPMCIVHVANPRAIARGLSACTKCSSNLSVPHG
ncbi:hypothetical protein BDZ89DRAFT_1075720, partial [Hymenopellis radicata]